LDVEKKRNLQIQKCLLTAIWGRKPMPQTYNDAKCLNNTTNQWRDDPAPEQATVRSTVLSKRRGLVFLRRHGPMGTMQPLLTKQVRLMIQKKT